LETVRCVYAKWGRHPRQYATQDWLTFLGKHNALRRRAARATGAGPGARVLEVACGTGLNFNYDRDIPGGMRRTFGNVNVEAFNLGTFSVATSTREPAR
jgi:hypothetical protein